MDLMGKGRLLDGLLTDGPLSESALNLTRHISTLPSPPSSARLCRLVQFMSLLKNGQDTAPGDVTKSFLVEPIVDRKHPGASRNLDPK